LLPPSLRDWLPEEHLAFFLSDTIDALDLSAFDERYGDAGSGNQALDPTRRAAEFGGRRGRMSEKKAAHRRPERSLGRTLGFRFGLAFVALAATLLTIEAILQIGTLVIGGENRSASAGAGDEALRVLCMGDSNTWGVYVEPDQPWPAQLEARWSEPGRGPLQVVNMGYPGVNSSRVRAEIERSIELIRPHFTLVMVGANDHWTDVVEDRTPGETGSQSVVDLFREHSRLYKLAYMLLQSTRPWEHSANARGDEAGQLVIGGETFDFAYQKRLLTAMAHAREMMGENLREIVRRAESAGTILVLMTYPAQETTMYYPFASKQIRHVALETDTPLIDLHEIFAGRCRDARCRRLLYQDGHPNAEGYRIVADEVARKLGALLGRAPDTPGNAGS
jgi:lysophospholipase L1-like esterase